MASIKSPAISVVMAAYNAEEYLTEAIESILDQTFTDFELIIIEDGSKDRTPEVLKTYAAKDARVRIISHKENRGLIFGLNEGFRAARGKYIARMDADDVSLPERLSRQYEYMESHPDIIILGTQSAYIDEQGTLYGLEPFLLHDREIRTEIVIRNRQFRHGAVMIRKESIQDSEYYNPSAVHYEDYEYWPRLLRLGKAANLPQVLYYYRKSGTSLTATKMPEMTLGTKQVQNRELQSIQLPPVGYREAGHMLKTARSYNPAHIVLEGKEFRTGYRWEYQSHLFAVAKLYYNQKQTVSAIWVTIACFLVNPLQFMYNGVVSGFRAGAQLLKK